MASKKKNPSFEIPDAVRHAGQSGWVYRTDPAKGKARRDARAPRARTTPVVPATERPATASQPNPDPPTTDVQADQAAGTWAASTGFVGLGLHVAAVPLVVPLYVTAAISRKLGLLPR